MSRVFGDCQYPERFCENLTNLLQRSLYYCCSRHANASTSRQNHLLQNDRALKFQEEAEPLWKTVESDQFVRDASHLAKYIVDYRTELSRKRLPVLPDFRQIEPGYLRSLLPNKAPEDGEDFETVFDDFRDKVIPGITHWQHPNFHAYFPTGSTYPSMLGDLLSSALAPVGVTWMACPACTELEVITLDWLVQALGLPEKFLSTCSRMDRFYAGGGTIESSASLACATLMMGLRENALAKLFGNGFKKTKDGLRGCGAATNVDRLVAYTSDQAHSSVTRAFRISMMRYREIPTKPVGRKRVFSAEELRRAMAQDKAAGLIPLVCVATTGTTSTCEFDDVEAIGRVCKEFNVWFHLDAAYAGNALLCPEYRTLADGLQLVNSVCINPDKLMMVNFDCTVLWVDDQEVLTKSFEEDPTYLKDNFRGMPEYWVSS
ncbi:hypothetical protein P879_09961 [Paragonimus westermani]|uniref:Aromatic-L-amino-acid/L-tryptophan decarboxylase n=1 Tax=Paragonimus westermani TaxID=34504 RepID=A0A8T0DDW0_9TREM|nr:hypothetical protein P879_09961 [Paragonimus westermani]